MIVRVSAWLPGQSQHGYQPIWSSFLERVTETRPIIDGRLGPEADTNRALLECVKIGFPGGCLMNKRQRSDCVAKQLQVLGASESEAAVTKILAVVFSRCQPQRHLVFQFHNPATGCLVLGSTPATLQL